MNYIILILIFLLLLPCRNFYRSSSGIYYTSRNGDVANLVSVLREISFKVADDLPSEDANVLRTSLNFTTFKELNGDKPTVLAWNYDKGREIAIRIYDRHGDLYSADKILLALFHELAHTLSKKNGHGPTFIEKDKLIQQYRHKYVKMLINNTFLTR